MFNIAWFILALLLLAAAFAELIVNSYFPMWMLFAMAVLCLGIGQTQIRVRRLKPISPAMTVESQSPSLSLCRISRNIGSA